MGRQTIASTNEQQALPIVEVARRFNIPMTTLETMIERGDLVAVDCAGSWYIPMREMAALEGLLFLSVAQVAARLGYTPGRVERLLTQGKLPARIMSGAWQISAYDLGLYIERTQNTVSVTDAAGRLGIGPNKVYVMIEKGKIPALKIRGRWKICTLVIQKLQRQSRGERQ